MIVRYIVSGVAKWVSIFAWSFSASFVYANSPFSEAQLTDFCENKPIWGAFDIQPSACRKAVEYCIVKPKFQHIDPVVLTEPFYLCVFTQLDIEV